MWTFGSRTDQELTTVLVQVFIDQLVTIGKVFLWATSLQCF